MDYLIGKVQYTAKGAVLEVIQNVEDDRELRKGISLREKWPQNAHFKMDDSFPKNKNLEDFHVNGNRVLVVSEKVHDLLSKEDLKNNEWLPVSILDHKGKVASDSYFILNQIGLQDCINKEESEYKVNRADKEKFMRVNELVLDEDKIDDDVSIFRMRYFTQIPIFKRSLAEKLRKKKFLGIEFVEIEDWDD